MQQGALEATGRTTDGYYEIRCHGAGYLAMSSRFLMGLAGLLSPQHDSSGPGSSLTVGGLSRAIQQGGGQRLFRLQTGSGPASGLFSYPEDSSSKLMARIYRELSVAWPCCIVFVGNTGKVEVLCKE